LSVYLGLAPGETAHAAFTWVNLGLATVAVLVGGPVFFKGAIAGLRRRTLHLDVPIALGIAVAWGGSLALVAAGDADAAYFDTLTIFIALMLAGRFVQERLLQRSRRLLLEDPGVGGLHVRRVDADERVHVVPAGSVGAGDRLLIAPGELVPVDAALVDQDGSFSLAWINGESEPAGYEAGAVVPAGAHLVGREARRMVAAGDFSSSGLGDLLARGTRGQGTPAVRFWDMVVRYYVVVVLGFAAVGFAAWAPTSLAAAVQVAVAVLVVTCPCALGLATPLAYELGHADLRRRGLFVRRSEFFDKALSVRKVFLDKTGTLTLGTLVVSDPAAVHALPREARAALHEMTARSNHPKSRALFALLADAGFALDPAAQVQEIAGSGLSFSDAGGVPWRLARGDDADPRLVLTRDGAPLLTVGFDESLRPDAHGEIAALEARGLDVWLLSGDEPAKVAAAAAALGVRPERALGNLSPRHKAELVRAADHRDTLMVGDGINDALALAAAWCAGTPAIDRPTLPARADFFVIAGGDIGPLARALEVAHRVRAVVRRNLGFAVAYNAAGIGLALAGLVTPLVCAVAMPISSVVVLVTTAWTLGRDRAMRGPSEPQLAEVSP
jgi:Cu2+-exporting ATPase